MSFEKPCMCLQIVWSKKEAVAIVVLGILSYWNLTNQNGYGYKLQSRNIIGGRDHISKSFSLAFFELFKI